MENELEVVMSYLIYLNILDYTIILSGVLSIVSLIMVLRINWKMTKVLERTKEINIQDRILRQIQTYNSK